MRPLAFALVAASAAAVACASACAFDTTRTAGLGDGEIRITAARDDDKPAAAARASLVGSSRVTQADEQGRLVFTGLVAGRWLARIVEDDDGDGVAERGADVPVELVRAPVPKNLTDGLAGEAATVVTSVLIGDVPAPEGSGPLVLLPTGSVRGTVTTPGGALVDGEGARVVVWRDVDGYATPVEASAAVEDDGSYVVRGLVPGPVHVAAFVFATGEEGDPAEATLYGTGGAVVASGEDAALDIAATTSPLLEGGGPRLVAAQVDAQWTLPEPAAVDIVLTSFTAAGTGAFLFGVQPDDTPHTLEADEPSFVIDAPIGVVDMLFSTATQGAADGLLRGQVVVPDLLATLGPVELPLLADPCDVSADDGARDCDHDGLPGLPFPSGLDDPAWVACVAACSDAFGAEFARATCGAGDDAVDCDDDGDGQPDVTEPLRCLGPGVGTDLDGDDLCEPAEDPTPPGSPFSAPPPRYGP